MVFIHLRARSNFKLRIDFIFLLSDSETVVMPRRLSTETMILLHERYVFLFLVLMFYVLS
jgi:hypothetical protein